MFVRLFLFAAGFGIGHAYLMAQSQSIEGLDLAALVEPVLLACGGALFRRRDDCVRLFNGL